MAFAVRKSDIRVGVVRTAVTVRALDLGRHQSGQGERLDDEYEEDEHRSHLLLERYLVSCSILTENDLRCVELCHR